MAATGMRYRNHGYLESRPELALPVGDRLSEERLADLGGRFVAEQLPGLVKLGDGEKLVPLFNEFQIEGGGAAFEGAPLDAEVVRASAIVFTRTLDDLPVVGAGSKVAVLFDNAGEAVGFDLDWPEYKVNGAVQEALPLEGILDRFGEHGTLRPDGEGVEIRHFECGYFDPGVRSRDAGAPVQSACFLQAARRSIADAVEHAKNPGSGHLLIAVAEAMPAGAEVAPDASWPQAQAVLGAAPKGGPEPDAGPAE